MRTCFMVTYFILIFRFSNQHLFLTELLSKSYNEICANTSNCAHGPGGNFGRRSSLCSTSPEPRMRWRWINPFHILIITPPQHLPQPSPVEWSTNPVSKLFSSISPSISFQTMGLGGDTLNMKLQKYGSSNVDSLPMYEPTQNPHRRTWAT